MRVLAMGVLGVAACGSTSGGEDPAREVRVEMPGLAPFGGPPFVSFSDPDGDLVSSYRVDSGWWVAEMPRGGSFFIGQAVGASPSYISTIHTRVLGVQPGDSFARMTGPLPVTCRCREVTLVPDATGSSWTDPDAAAVDARILTVSEYSPFQGGSTSTEVDGLTATHVDARAEMNVDVRVIVITCDPESYDDIRTLLPTSC